MPDLHPDIGAVFVDIDIASQTVAHFLKPYLAEAVFGKLAVLSFIMTAGFEEVKGNLPNGGINHIVDFTGNQAEFGPVVLQAAQQRLESYHFAENRGDFFGSHPAVFVQIAVFGAQLMMAAMTEFMRQSQDIILKMARSSILSNLYDLIGLSVQWQDFFIGTFKMYNQPVNVSHEKVLQAIKDRDPERASMLMGKHLTDVVDNAKKLYLE